MLKIMADVFSGRPNPAWVLTDEPAARTIWRELAQNRTLVAQAAPPEASLGFRGFFVELLSDELARDVDLPTALYIAVSPGIASAKANELAERLIGVMTRAEAWAEAADVDTLALDESLQTFLRAQLEVSARTSVLDIESLLGAPPEAGSEAVAAAAYTIELAPYNPGFWNNNPTILRNNNCYNYASNKRTDTFAQPGRGCGRMYTAITCPEMTRAALCDGLHRRYDCFPPSDWWTPARECLRLGMPCPQLLLGRRTLDRLPRILRNRTDSSITVVPQLMLARRFQ